MMGLRSDNNRNDLTFEGTIGRLGKILHGQQPLALSMAHCCSLIFEVDQVSQLEVTTTCRSDCHAVNRKLPCEVSGDTLPNDVFSI